MTDRHDNTDDETDTLSAEYQDSLSLRQALEFANLWQRMRGVDPYAAVRAYAELHGPLGVRRVKVRPIQPANGRALVEGEPITAWLDEIKAAERAFRGLRMLGAFTIGGASVRVDEWQWFITEGRLDGPKDERELLRDTRELINRKLREHGVVLALEDRDRLPLAYALVNPTQAAALWKTVAECASGVRRVAFCAVCNRPLVYEGELNRKGRRKDAKTCSDACRKQRERNLRRQHNKSREAHKR